MKKALLIFISALLIVFVSCNNGSGGNNPSAESGDSLTFDSAAFYNAIPYEPINRTEALNLINRYDTLYKVCPVADTTKPDYLVVRQISISNAVVKVFQGDYNIKRLKFCVGITTAKKLKIILQVKTMGDNFFYFDVTQLKASAPVDPDDNVCPPPRPCNTEIEN